MNNKITVLFFASLAMISSAWAGGGLSKAEGVCTAAAITKGYSVAAAVRECSLLSSEGAGICAAAGISKGYSILASVRDCAPVSTEGSGICAAAAIAKDFSIAVAVRDCQ